MDVPDKIITVENISKIYRVGVKEEMHDSLLRSMIEFAKSPLKNFRKYRSLYRFDEVELNDSIDENNGSSDILWALRNVSFDVAEGEVLGIIGRNGAGKSTLLKVLSRITEPTSGVATVHGRISSLLEVGTGFHPELSGRENVYLNGTILGMRKKEIDQKFDEIVAFSEIEKFLDTPVKRYSSGMRVRLAFSVAAHLEPEILIIDEVLAVGDTAFQKKCLGKMEGVAKEGRTVLFVSHNMSLVAELCTRCLLMQNGKVSETGDTKDIVSKYISTDRSSGSIDLKDWSIERQGNGPMRVSYLHTEDEHGRIRAHFQHGEPMIFKIGVSGRKSSQCIIGLSVRNTFGQLILHFSNLDDDAELTLPTDESFVTMRLENNVLNDGQYYVTVFLGDGFNIKNDYVYNCLFFEIDSTVQGRVVCNSPVRLPAHWEIS